MELLTKSGKLMQEQSKARQQVIALNKLDEINDEQRDELSTLVDRLESIEPEIRTANVAEAAERAELEAENRGAANDDGIEPEIRERNEIAKKSQLGNYLVAAIRGQRVHGAEAELRDAFNMDDGSIPTACMDVEHREQVDARKAETRALTPSPSTVGVNLDMVQPYVFSASIASLLGVEVRNVPTGTYSIPTISTAPSTAAPKAKNTAADATAAALTVASASPKRIPAQLTLTLEDIAAVGTETFESGLRTALQGQVAHSFDNQIINGNGTAPNLNGFLAQLDNADAPASGVEDFQRWAAIVASMVDGNWATRLSEVASVWNAASFVQAAAAFRGNQGDTSAATYMNAMTAGFFANSRMPATASNIATGIGARLGQPGIVRAVVPSWGRIEVDDIYSGAPSGLRHITLSVIVGDLLLVQPDAYVELKARVST